MANERIETGLQQAKDDVSGLKAAAERKVDEVKFDIEVDRAKAKVERQLDAEAAKDQQVFNAVSADAKARRENLQAQQAQLKSEISASTGEARTRLQAKLDSVSEQIATSEAAMDAYYARRDEGFTDLT
jgi:DNA anti-recombination protein RmuC